MDPQRTCDSALSPSSQTGFRSSGHRAGCCPVGVCQAADANSGTPAEPRRHGPSASVSTIPASLLHEIAPRRPYRSQSTRTYGWVVHVVRTPPEVLDWAAGGVAAALQLMCYRFAVYLTGRPSPQNPGSISFSPVRGRWSAKPRQAAPWLSKWNSCSGSRVGWFWRSGSNRADVRS